MAVGWARMTSGVATTKSGTAARTRRPAGLLAFLGALTLGALWLGPLPAMAATAFSPHMILHLGLVGIAAPLLAGAVVLSRPAAGEGAPLPVALVVAVALAEMLVVWGWHLPALHAGAARSGALFVLQQASFLAAAMLVWITAFSGRRRGDRAVGALLMGGTFVHMTMIGLVFALAGRPLYPVEVCGGAFGLAPLADQQLGGTLMAVFGAFPYLGGAVALSAGLLADPDAPRPNPPR